MEPRRSKLLFALLMLVRLLVPTVLLGGVAGAVQLVARALGPVFGPAAVIPLVGYAALGGFTADLFFRLRVAPAPARHAAHAAPTQLSLGHAAALALFVLFTFEVVGVFVVAAGEAMKAWNLAFGGFASHDGSDWNWIAYAFSWVADSGLAGFGQIFGWQVSDVQPITSAARTFVWIYNLLLDFVVIAGLVRVVSRVKDLRAHSAGSSS